VLKEMAVFRRAAAGFSLMEVLVALLIFSLGLLGLAGMLVFSLRSNQSAYIRSQASFLAQSMADRMRANVAMVWTGVYTVPGWTSSQASLSSGSAPCAGGAACSSADVAARDIFQWKSQIGTLMPLGTTATITCSVPSGATPPGYAPVGAESATGAPYPGLCTIGLAWTETSLNRSTQGQAQVAGNATPETMTWVFTP
jgi:type IV pilus assembly protein PilV